MTVGGEWQLGMAKLAGQMLEMVRRREQLQLRVVEAAAPCSRGCNPMWWRLQPYASRLRPHVSGVAAGATRDNHQGGAGEP